MSTEDKDITRYSGSMPGPLMTTLLGKGGTEQDRIRATEISLAWEIRKGGESFTKRKQFNRLEESLDARNHARKVIPMRVVVDGVLMTHEDIKE